MLRDVARHRRRRAGVYGHGRGLRTGPLTLYVSATDASGMPVTDLKAEEITMSENGMPGKIVSVEKFSLPIKLTIGIDNGPDSPNALSHYRTGLTELVKTLPPDVEVTLITMAPQPRMVVKRTLNREEILRGITRFAPGRTAGPFHRHAGGIRAADRQGGQGQEAELLTVSC